MVDNVIIVTSSKTGFTERYGQWLKEMTGVTHYNFKDLKDDILNSADIVVFGSGVYGNELNHVQKMRRIVERNPDKRFIFFAVGINPPSVNVEKRLLNYNFPHNDDIELYYLPGGLNKERLDSKDQSLRIIYRAMIKRRGNLTELDNLLVERLTLDGDYTDRKYLEPLIESIQNGRQIEKGVENE